MDGIHLKDTTKNNINKTTTAHNNRLGMFLFKSNDIYIVEPTSIYNNRNGMYTRYVNHTHIDNIIVTHNSKNGVVLRETGHIFIRNLFSMYNIWAGMFAYVISNSNFTGIINYLVQWKKLSLCV